MIIDKNKLQRQEHQVQLWITGNCAGTLEAVTGYGKTFVAILAIQRLQRKYPQATIDVVLPKINLLQDWIDPKRGHIAKHGLLNIEAFVVNTYVRQGRRKPTLLVLDEVHNYVSEEFGKVFEIASVPLKINRVKGDTFVLGLTATLERIDGKHSYIEKYCPIFDRIDMIEAKAKGYISDFKIYNLGLELTEQERIDYNKIHDIFNNAFGKFNHDFEFAMICAKGRDVPSKYTATSTIKENGKEVLSFNIMVKTTSEWQYWYAQKNEWDGTKDHFWSPFNIAKYAQQFISSMLSRKQFLYRAQVKVVNIIWLIRNLKLKTMIFAEDSIFADKITEQLGEEICMSYHTKIQSRSITVEVIDKKGRVSSKPKKLGKSKVLEMILEDFKKPNGLQVISSVKALQEGFDYAGVRLIIIASFNSSKRADTQISGRGTRKDYMNLDKTAIIVNTYIKESQEEKWLKDKQKGKKGIIWIDSVQDINVQKDIFDIELG